MALSAVEMGGVIAIIVNTIYEAFGGRLGILSCAKSGQEQLSTSVRYLALDFLVSYHFLRLT